MLQFFRRFQKSIFIAITAIIVISFSFFGTYRAYQQAKGSPDEEVFTSYLGTSVKRSEFDQLVHFISTDMIDSLVLGAPLGPNFLNDGVVRKDFLESGLADDLIAHFSESFNDTWQEKYAREKRFSPYRHHDVDFISAMSVWGQFAPDLREAFATYKKGSFETVNALFDAKRKLYLAESHFPQSLTKRVLAYQMEQNGFAKPDMRLHTEDLSLFGYHTVSDWFGPDFVKLVAQVIINLSEVAQERGYSVTKEEALIDLAKRAHEAFDAQKSNPNFSIDSPAAYLQQQVRLLGLDTSGAAKVWQKVMLFRRLFSDIGSSVMVDNQTVAPYAEYLSQKADVVTYRLPKALRFSQFKDLQLFETYLHHTAASEMGVHSPLHMHWLATENVAGELLSKRYLLEVSRVDQSALLGKVGVKQVWAKELDPHFFTTLKEAIPELGLASDSTEEERLLALDNLDSLTRARADRMARKAIVESHKDWLEEASYSAPFEKKSITLYKEGGPSPLPGVKNSAALMNLLEYCKPGETLSYNEEGTYFRIRLLEKSPDFEVATFAKSKEDGQLDLLLTKRLRGLYEQLGDDAPFESMREELAKEAFRSQLLKIQKEFPEATTPDIAASYMMHHYLNEAKEILARGEELQVDEQFKLVVEDAEWSRDQSSLQTALLMEPGSYSAVAFAKNGDHSLFKLVALAHDGESEQLKELLDTADAKLSTHVQKLFMEDLLDEMIERGALSLGDMTSVEAPVEA